MTNSTVLDMFAALAGSVPNRDNSSNQGGGFVNTVNDESKYGNTNELTYEDQSLYLRYAPNTTTTNLYYLDLTDSTITGSANSTVETPGSISTSQQQTASQTAGDTKGLDVGSIIIPIAAAAAVGGLGYAAYKAVKSKGGKKT